MIEVRAVIEARWSVPPEMADTAQSQAPSTPGLGGGTLHSISSHLRAPRTWRGGPAWLVMIANVDAASVLTALPSGASDRYELIWFLVVLTIPLIFIQEARPAPCRAEQARSDRKLGHPMLAELAP
jgi:hypothetical protein